MASSSVRTCCRSTRRTAQSASAMRARLHPSDTSFDDSETGLVMSAERFVDIDDLEDFARAERLLEAR